MSLPINNPRVTIDVESRCFCCLRLPLTPRIFKSSPVDKKPIDLTKINPVLSLPSRTRSISFDEKEEESKLTALFKRNVPDH